MKLIPLIKKEYDLRSYQDVDAFQSVARQHGLADGRNGIPSLEPSEDELASQALKRLKALRERTQIIVSDTGPLEMYWPHYTMGWQSGRLTRKTKQGKITRDQ